MVLKRKLLVKNPSPSGNLVIITMGIEFKFAKIVEFIRRSCEHCYGDCRFKGLKQTCEYDKKYYMHYHILCDKYIPQHVLSKALYDASKGTAYIV